MFSLNKALISLSILTTLPHSINAAPGNPVINEIMQSNVWSLMTEYDFPDSWVELYNPSDEVVDLSGWTLGIKKTADKGYQLPDGTIIEPQGFLLILCDKEETGLHTGFRLESTSKGSVYLFDADGNVIDQIDHAKMPAPDIAYGRFPDGSDNWAYYTNSTPGALNDVTSAAVSDKLLPEPIFSHRGGIYSDSLAVTVSFPDTFTDSEATLCVTTDGRFPTASDSVSNPFTLDINSSTPVRALIVSPNHLSPQAVTQTYLFPDREMTMPVVCLTTDPALLYDDEIGLFAGEEGDPDANYLKEWRRPLNVEMYDGDSLAQVFNQTGETAIQGWSSRVWPQKSLKIYANKRFGTKRFYHALWESDKPDVTEIPSFSLRNAGNTFTTDHLRDSYYHNLFGHHVHGVVDYQAYRPVIAFINGLPYGLIDLRERSNEDHIESNYPDEEDFCMVEDWYEFKTDVTEPFYTLVDMYNDPNSTFAELDAELDMVSFATSLIADAYGFNVDTPGGNKVMWKPKDGKWKMFLKDMDCVNYMKLVDNDYIDYLYMVENDEYESWYKNTPTGTALYRKCLSFPEFVEILIDRFVAYYGDFLRPDISVTLLQDMADEIEDEFRLLTELYGLDCWFSANVTRLQDYMRERGQHMFNHFSSRYDLGEIIPLTISSDDTEITVNGHILNYNNFDGYCFADRAVRIEASVDGDWVITETDSEGNVTTETINSESLNWKPSAGTVQASIGFTDPAGIEEITVSPYPATEGETIYYTIEGRRLSNMPNNPGLYIQVNGTSAKKIRVR